MSLIYAENYGLIMTLDVGRRSVNKIREQHFSFQVLWDL